MPPTVVLPDRHSIQPAHRTESPTCEPDYSPAPPRWPSPPASLLVIPASPASAHCVDTDHIYGDEYNNGGIWFDQTPYRNAPHTECNTFGPITIDFPDIHCAQQVLDNPNDWLYFNYDGRRYEGWVREGAAFVAGDVWVQRCQTDGLVHITETRRSSG
jgi:hypothetical protein